MRPVHGPGALPHPVSKGIEIIEGLRGHTFRLLRAHLRGGRLGGGKTPVMPQYIISQTPKKVILRNYEGVITTYTEPEHYTDCQCDYCTGKKKKELMGVKPGLERGQALSMEPAGLGGISAPSRGIIGEYSQAGRCLTAVSAARLKRMEVIIVGISRILISAGGAGPGPPPARGRRHPAFYRRLHHRGCRAHHLPPAGH